MPKRSTSRNSLDFLYRAVASIALVALFSSSLVAQTKPREAAVQAQARYNDSGVDVVVTDQSGAVVQSAQVLVLNQEGKKIADGKSNEYGRFRVSGLAAADYVVSAQAPGFVISRQPVIVLSDDIPEITVVLKVAATTQLIQMGTPAFVQIETTRIDEDEIDRFAFELQRRPQPLLLDTQSARPERH